MLILHKSVRKQVGPSMKEIHRQSKTAGEYLPSDHTPLPRHTIHTNAVKKAPQRHNRRTFT